MSGLVVLAAGTVVSDLRIGENDDLAGIRGVGENFLVAGEAGIKNNFTAAAI